MTSPLRLLIWLKWTLTWRGYRRSRSQVAGAIIILIVFLPLSLFGAYGVWVLDRDYPSLFRLIARDSLGIIYLLWAATPLLGFTLNESFDLTRLFVYPVSFTRLFIGSILGGLLDRATLLALPVLIVLLAFSAVTPLAFLLALPLLLLFLLQTLALGQALMLMLIGFLRSRRFRDLTIVLFPLIGMGYYIGQRLLVRRMEEGLVTVPALVQAPGWNLMNWLPPGWAADGLKAAQDGQAGAALGYFALLSLATVVTVGAAVLSLRNLYLGETGPVRARPMDIPLLKKHQQKNPAARFLSTRHLSGDIAAVAWKEWIYFRRDPQYKALAIQSVYTLVWLSASLFLPSLQLSSSPLFGGPWLLFAVSGALLLSLVPLLFNIWAGEGAALTVLFSFPTPRRALLLGKNLAHAALLLLTSVVGLTLVAALTRQWSSLPLTLTWVVLAVPLLLAAGSLVAIRFPHRMLVRGQRWGRGGLASSTGASGAGCAYSFLYLLTYGAVFLALVPILAAVALPGLFGISHAWLYLSLPAAAIYSVTLYVVLLRQAEVWLLAREPEILGRIVPE